MSSLCRRPERGPLGGWEGAEMSVPFCGHGLPVGAGKLPIPILSAPPSNCTVPEAGLHAPVHRAPPKVQGCTPRCAPAGTMIIMQIDTLPSTGSLRNSHLLSEQTQDVGSSGSSSRQRMNIHTYEYIRHLMRRLWFSFNAKHNRCCSLLQRQTSPQPPVPSQLFIRHSSPLRQRRPRLTRPARPACE